MFCVGVLPAFWLRAKIPGKKVLLDVNSFFLMIFIFRDDVCPPAIIGKLIL